MNNIEPRLSRSLGKLDQLHAQAMSPTVVARVKRRRLAMIVGITAVAALAAVGVAAAVPSFLTRNDRSIPPTDRVTSTPDCGRIDIASDAYGTELSAYRGRPGKKVVISGTTLRGEDGRFAPFDRIEMWWNADSPGGPPLKEGPVELLATIPDESKCYFSEVLTIPDAPSGTYEIVPIVFDDSGHGLFLSHRFMIPPETEEGTASDYPLVYEGEGLRIHAPESVAGSLDGQPWGWCPEKALEVTETDLPEVERVISVYSREFANDPAFERVEVVARREENDFAFDYSENICGAFVAGRTIAVDTTYPDMVDFSASLSQAIYFVVKEERGWVIWNVY